MSYARILTAHCRRAVFGVFSSDITRLPFFALWRFCLARNDGPAAPPGAPLLRAALRRLSVRRGGELAIPLPLKVQPHLLRAALLSFNI